MTYCQILVLKQSLAPLTSLVLYSLIDEVNFLFMLENKLASQCILIIFLRQEMKVASLKCETFRLMFCYSQLELNNARISYP